MILADSGISNRLIKPRSLIDQTHFEFIDVSSFGAIDFLQQNTSDAYSVKQTLFWFIVC